MYRRCAFAVVFIQFIALAATAQDASSLIAEGDAWLQKGEYQKALGRYDEAVKVSPTAMSYVARARALYAMDHLDGYLMDVERALRMDSTIAEAHVQRAIYALRSQDQRRAVRHCNSALALDLSPVLRPHALIARGIALADLGRRAEAIADLRAGLELDPHDVEALGTLARMLDATGDHAEALPLLERLCELEPNDPGHWTNRGFELARLGRHDEALLIYDRALDLDRDEPLALSNKAASLLAMGREDEAMKNVQRSLRVYPANPFALRTRAMLYVKKGEIEKACEDLHLTRVLGGVPDVDTLISRHCSQLTPKR